MHCGLFFVLLSLPLVVASTPKPINGPDCFISNGQLQPSGCGESCREQTLEALQAMHELTHGSGDWWYDYEGNTRQVHNWGECQRCNSSNGNRLPSYCCWPGVSCCHQRSSFTMASECNLYSVTALQLPSAQITAPFHDMVPHLATLHRFGLQYLDIGRNFITGTIPPSIGELTNLKVLLLGSNNLTGTVPATISNLKQLQHLDLEFNFLSGGMNFLCNASDSSLESLYLRANNFSGPLDLTRCLQLQIVDVQENWFSGPLPVNGNNRNLIVLRARQNYFSGNLSVDVWTLPRLITLDLTNNSMSGELPQRASPSSQLNRLFLGGNNFSGSVPWGFADSSQLSDLDLGDNPWISGTLPNLEWMSGLVTFVISNTRIHGTIPRELGRLPFLQTVDLHNTLMTCCRNEDEAHEKAANGSLVPDFLVMDRKNTQQPIIDFRVASRDADFAHFLNTGGNMTCPTVRRKREGSFAFGSGVLRPANLSGQTWFVDPEYYWFTECSCLEGFKPSKEHNISIQRLWCADGHGNSSSSSSCVNMTVTTCSPRNPDDFEQPVLTRQQLAALIICGLAFCLLMIMMSSVTINMCIARTGKIRRQLDWWHKHLAGMPKSGKMSIVVTDIEGYSDLFKRCPELMYKALTLHNNVIRRCKYEHCGSTVQQEGDSYTLVFHEAFDAVAFCLQAQQALLDVNWPDGLMDPDISVGHNSNNSTHSKQGRRSKFSQLEGMSSLFAGGPSSWLKKSKLQNSKQQGTSASAPVASADSLALTLSTVAAGSPPTTAAAAGPLTSPTSPSAPVVFGSHVSRSRMLDLFRSHSSATAAVFNGLRVRMGVATGVVEAQTEHSSESALANILNSALFKLAVDVSDAGNGGQILMESETFHRIKEELHPLGAIDSNGLNYNKLAQRTSLWHLLFLGSLCSRRRGEVLEVDEAVVLDMGEYTVPSLPPPAASMRVHAANATKRFLKLSTLMPSRYDGRGRGHQDHHDGGGWELTDLAGIPVKDAAAAAAVWEHKGGSGINATLDREQHTSFLPGSMKHHFLYHHTAAAGAFTTASDNQQLIAPAAKRPRVRLVQILPPALVIRASVWGNKMSLKDSWVCMDAPYFEAPGALEAPLGPSLPHTSLSLGKSIRSASESTPTQRNRQQQQQQQRPQDSGVTAIAAAAAADAKNVLSVVNSASGSLSSSFSATHQQQQQQAVESESLTSQSSITAAATEQQQQQPVRAFSIPRSAGSGCGPSIIKNPIPPVTMVFLCVEGAKVFGSRKKQLLKDVHSLLSVLLMEALRHVPGGYLCRMQEGDLKYMIAFSSARSALEWCLVVQEAAMYLDWPDTKWQKQKINQLTPEYDSDGRLMFRGPRLKMGVCEGVPRTIIPDHLGRADYHGASINQAARYMDAAAHGGQIACEAQMAIAVLSQWQPPAAPAPGQAAAAAATENGQVYGASLSPVSEALDYVPRTQSAPAAADRCGGFAAEENQQHQHQQHQQLLHQQPADCGLSSSPAVAAAAANGVNSSNTSDEPGVAPVVSPFLAAAGISVDQTPLETATVETSPNDDVDNALAPAQSAGDVVTAQVAGSSNSSSTTTSTAAAAAAVGNGLASYSRSGLGIRLHKLQLFKKEPAVAETAGESQVSGTSGVTLRGGTQSDHGSSTAVQASGTSGDLVQSGQQQQQQQLPQGWEGLPLHLSTTTNTAAVAAATAVADHKPLFGLADVPKVQSEVQIHHIGSFRFKGNPQPLDMVNVMLTSLTGRQGFFPVDPPKGKGNRVAARSGVAAAAAVPLPALAQQYRSHVPDHILQQEISASQSFNDRHRLRSSSMPVQRSGRLFALDGGNAAANAPAAVAAATPASVFTRLHSRRTGDLLPTLGPDSQAAAAAADSSAADTLTNDAHFYNGRIKQQRGYAAASNGSSNADRRGQGLLPVFDRSMSAVVGGRYSYPLSAGDVMNTQRFGAPGKNAGGTWGDRHSTAFSVAAGGGGGGGGGVRGGVVCSRAVKGVERSDTEVADAEHMV